LHKINNIGVFFHKNEVVSLQHLNLQDVNFIVFPDWSISSENLYTDLHTVLEKVLSRPDSDRIAVLIDANNTDADAADELLAEVVMNLVMQPDLELAREPQISLITDLDPLQWQFLLRRIQMRIKLDREDINVVRAVEVRNLPVCQLDELNDVVI
jgi:hypothetical protein